MRFAVSAVASDIAAIRVSVSKALGYPRLAVAVGGGYHLPPGYTMHAMQVLVSDGQFATGIPEVAGVSSAVLSAIEEGLTGTQLAAVAKAAALPDVFSSDIVSDAVKES